MFGKTTGCGGSIVIFHVVAQSHVSFYFLLQENIKIQVIMIQRVEFKKHVWSCRSSFTFTGTHGARWVRLTSREIFIMIIRTLFTVNEYNIQTKIQNIKGNKRSDSINKFHGDVIPYDVETDVNTAPPAPEFCNQTPTLAKLTVSHEPAFPWTVWSFV